MSLEVERLQQELARAQQDTAALRQANRELRGQQAGDEDDTVAPSTSSSAPRKQKKSVSFGGDAPAPWESQAGPVDHSTDAGAFGPSRRSRQESVVGPFDVSQEARKGSVARPSADPVGWTRKSLSAFPSDLDTIPASPFIDETGRDIRQAPGTSQAQGYFSGITPEEYGQRRKSQGGSLTGDGRTPASRRKSSSVAPNASPRGSFTRRLSQFNPFDRSFASAEPMSDGGAGATSEPTIRRTSFMNFLSGRTVSDTAATTADGSVTEPPKAKTRSKSTSAAGFFRNPFAGEGEEDVAIDPTRRQSAPMVRRPSQFQRAWSIVNEPNPIPPRYRTKSVSSLAYFVTPLKSSNSTLPIFEDDIETQKENIQEYLAGVELRQASMKRKPWQSHTWQGAYFFIVVAFVYFVLIGQPIWPGAAVLYYRWLRQAHLSSLGVLIFVGWAALQSYLPILFGSFEKEVDSVEERDARETALIIPAYKAANILPETIEHALKIFKPEQIFIVNNGNSENPLDDTAGVCARYGVNHAWVPVGSKIVAEFVGVALTKQYKYVMLIDDDVHLPANLPLVTSRINERTKCIGYTIKSTGENGIKGTGIQQCQDMEYKTSGLTRTFCGKYGSATFPHGAIILWDREVLQDLFNVHPGYTISEDWYFGHAARSSGYRIEFCSQVFVPTETPPAFIKSSAAARGGFGEMTVFKQRFGRWNYFFVFRIWEDTIYILFSWRLGFWRELITKIYVLVEIYDSIMGFLRPFVVVITIIAAWKLFLIMTGALLAMYMGAFFIMNAWHLRRKNEMVSWKILPQ